MSGYSQDGSERIDVEACRKMIRTGVTITKSEAALQCCLTCGRTLTDREQHDALEASVLEGIRAEHPEWADAEGNCAPCVTHYRALLKARVVRAELHDALKARQQMRGTLMIARMKRFAGMFLPALISR